MNASGESRSRVSVDTNVLLRATLDETGLESQSQVARRILASGRSEVVVAEVAVAEYVHALEVHYGLDRAAICELVSAVIQPTHVVCEKRVISAALTHYAARPKLSFDDCFIAEYARARRALPVWTFDKKLAAQHPAAELAEFDDTA